MKGMMGKKRVDIMSPTAMEASSMSSMAILILVRKKMSTMRTMSSKTADTMRKTSLKLVDV